MLRSKSSSIRRTSCPRCGECPFSSGVCEEKISRGRRFFMLGALALPVAAQIARVASVVAPPRPAEDNALSVKNVSTSHVRLWTGQTIYPGDVVAISQSIACDGHYVVTRAGAGQLVVVDAVIR